MINTDTETDYWPWKWMHDGRECQTREDFRNAWLSIDPFADNIFTPRVSKHTNKRGDDLERKVSENIVCVHDEFKVTDKISLADYQDYSIKKFDSQMEKIANKHPKLFVGMSGGIDSSMVFSWCVKNKVDMKSFVWQNDVWQGEVNKMMAQKVLEIGQQANVPMKLYDLGTGEFNMDKVLTEYCEADIFEFPHSNMVTHGNGWDHKASGWGALSAEYDERHKVLGLGTDELFLHRTATYVRLIPKRILEYVKRIHVPPTFLANGNYRIGVGPTSWPDKIEVNQQKQVVDSWDEYGYLGHLSGNESWPAATKEWLQAWHSIDSDSCSAEQYNDMINVGWLKRVIVDWVGDSWVDLIHSVPCGEKYHEMNPDFRKYILSQIDKFFHEYNKRGIGAEAFYWREWKQTLKYFNKISSKLLEEIHTLNWFLKNQK